MNAEKKIDALIAQERLPASYKNIVEQYWRSLARTIAEWRKEKDRPIVIGVNGAQGSGKSTLCLFLAEALLPELGISAVVISLDDFYLTKVEREELAINIHPLLQTRGVPGTHDVAALCGAIDGLIRGEAVSLPIFDKGRDDRIAKSRAVSSADIILFEGWCVGASAQDETALQTPVNALEREEDKDGVWRRYVNDCLKTDYQDLFSRLDRLVMLQIESMEKVLEHRRRQEKKLREARPDAPGVMNDEKMVRFIQHYERLTRHCLDSLPARADILIDLSSLKAGPKTK